MHTAPTYRNHHPRVCLRMPTMQDPLPAARNNCSRCVEVLCRSTRRIGHTCATCTTKTCTRPMRPWGLYWPIYKTLDSATIPSSQSHQTTVKHWVNTGVRSTRTNTLRRTPSCPWILAGPGITSARHPQPVSLVDVAPTLAEHLGLPLPFTTDGVSRLGAYNSTPFAEADQNGAMHHALRTVRMNSWK